MAAARIGALRVDLGLNSAQFQQGLGNAQSGMQRFARAAAVAMAAATAAATGAFMAIRGAAQDASVAMQQSLISGAGYEEFQRMAYGARAYGIEADKLSDIFKDVNDRVGDFMSTGGGPMADFFENIAPQVGMTADEFARLSGPEALQAYYNALEQAGLSQAEMTFYLEAMASDVTALIPLLQNGGEGFRALGDEAERLGLVLDERTGQASVLFTQNLQRLSGVMTGLWNQVLTKVIGGFVQLSERLVLATQEGGGLQVAVQLISSAMNVLVRVITLVADNLAWLIDVFKIFISMKVVLFLGSVAAGMIAFARTVRTVGIAMALVTRITKAKITALLALAAVAAQVTGTYDTLVGWVRNLGSTLYDALPATLRDGVDGLTAGLDELTGGIDALDASSAETFADMLSASNSAAASVGSVGSAASTAAGQVDTSMSAAQGSIQQFGVTADQVTSTLASGFTSMFTSALDGSKSLLASLGDLAKQVGSMFLNAGFQMLFGALMPGGGGLGSLLGGLFSFDGGGYTGNGPRVGGLDGMGGRLALVHPQETIIDHTKSGGTRAGAGKVEISVNVNGARGNMEIQQMVQTGVAQGLKTVERQFPSMMANAQMRGLT